MRFRAVALQALIAGILICQVLRSPLAEEREIEITGLPVPTMSSFDSVVANLMVKYSIPGGALAVAKDGRLVLAHGYGSADLDLRQLVQPNSLFRIASISKPITAVTILKLVEERRLDLDSKAFLILDNLKPKTGVEVDPRIWNLTIRQLLQHSGGWDRNRSFDPMFMPQKAAAAVGAPAPASCETVIRYMFTQPLDFDPGTRYVYSNFGYCVLGRIIERVSGQNYEEYVRTHVLEPMGITAMRIGHSLLEDRAENEVHYYDFSGAPPVLSIFSTEKEIVPWPYGGFYLEAMDSHGGWIASASDLVRFVVSVDGRRAPPFLRPDTVEVMISRPPPPLWVGTSYWYGMGWFVRPIHGNEADWWHTGSLPGTSALLVRTHHGLAWAALFNSRPTHPAERDFIGELDNSLWLIQSEVTVWPSHDLFATPRGTSEMATITTWANPSPTMLVATGTRQTEATRVGQTQVTAGAFTVQMLVIGSVAFAAALTGVFLRRRS